MQNSTMLLTFFVFDQKYPFWTNLVKIVNIVIQGEAWQLD